MSNEGKPEREPQVEIEVSKLDKRVAIVEELANTLSQRLDAIARSRCPQPESKSEDRPQLVELAERLFGIDRRVSAIADNLQNLLDRIEL